MLPNIPSNKNGLVQLITVENSIPLIWVNFLTATHVPIAFHDAQTSQDKQSIT